MSEWSMRRFWKEAGIVPEDGGYAVKLDGRGVKTPAKTPLVVPTMALAQAIAGEWDAQGEKVDPTGMPFTRMANSALDKVRTQHAEVADMLAAYGDSDLLCYRADHPAELVARQEAGWDPLLDWAAEALGAPLAPRVGVVHVAQKPQSLEALSVRVHRLGAFHLAAFHDLVGMTGSLILAFAVTEGRITPQDAWETSRIDENWQKEQWGADEEAEALATVKKAEFLHAATFFRLSTQ